MRFARLALMAVLLIAGFAAIPATAQNSTSPFLLFDELQIGMEGIGKTTIGGDQIRLFSTRIVGIVDNPGTLNDFILVRSSGDVIRDAGGYAQGMSGSPIYINNKLIGAFFAAYLFDQAPNPIGLVRPIETMLDLTHRIESKVEAENLEAANIFDTRDKSDEEMLSVFENVQLENGETKNIQLVNSAPSLNERLANPDTMYAVRASTPLWVNGLSGRSLESLSKGFNGQAAMANMESQLLPLPDDVTSTLSGSFYDYLSEGVEERFGSTVLPLAAATSASGKFAEEFEPGAPMGALLTTGDVSFGSVCTTSYIDYDANILLACGHEVFLTGDSNMFLTKAQVLDTVNSAQISFVLAQVDTENVYGTIMEDRTQAIGGSLGHQQESARLTARAHDVTTDVTNDITVNLADTTNLTASLVFSSLLQLVDETLNRIGKGTMKIDYTIRGEHMSQRVSRSDVFVSLTDVALAGPLQAAQMVFLIDQNEYVDPKIDRIDVDITTIDEVRLYELKQIERDKEVYHPGDEVRYIVVLSTYRGEDRRISGSFTIPEETTVRRLTLHGFGGPRRVQQSSQTQTTSSFESLDDLLSAIEQVTGNDQLTIELLGLPLDPDGEDGLTAPPAEIEFLGDWVVTGEDRINIQIEPRPEPEEEIEESLEKPEDHDSTGDEDSSRQDEESSGEEDTSDNNGSNGDEENGSESDEETEEDCDQLFYCD